MNASTLKLVSFCWESIADREDIHDEQKDDLNQSLYHSSIQFGNIDSVDYLLRMLSRAAPGKRAPVCRLNLFFRAAEYGRLALLQWACENDIFSKCGLNKDTRVCSYAIASGNIDLYHCAVEYGFEWNNESMPLMKKLH